MYHTFYVVAVLLGGKFKGLYCGVHSTENLNDNYLGSGVFLKNLVRTYGKENLVKLNKKFFSTREELVRYEKKVTNKDWYSSQYTLNNKRSGRSVNENNQRYSVQQKLQNLEKKLKNELKEYNSYLY